MSLGRDVTTVHDDAQLVAAVERAWEGDYIALVQTVAPGIDIRLDYLDGALLAGYRRRPIEITGDGRATVASLLQRLDRRFAESAYWRRHEGDEEWGRRVTAHGWTQESVLPEGQRIRFGGPVLNLNRWATADVIDTLTPAWHACMTAIGSAMHLRHFGVDFKVPCGHDPDAWADVDPWESSVIEVNASPSLVQLYRLGHEERAIQGLMRVMSAVMRG
jgi:cyanophycin synthetase